MKSLSISEVRHRLPALVEGVAQTQEPVVVTRYGSPMALITPIPARETGQNRYPLRGHPVHLSDDFDEPMAGMWSALQVAETAGRYARGKRTRSRKGSKS